MPEALHRVEAVRAFRLKSKSAPTRKIADTPTRFHVENIPSTPFLVIPKVSSERRRYIPIGFMNPDTLVSDLCFIVPDATIYDFGILSSGIHMAWVRQVCGRLKSDYRYSNTLVYNNFPWPPKPIGKPRATVEEKAQAVLDTRTQFPGSCLADLYDPLTMPPALLRAHAELDRAVEACYRGKAFATDRERVEYLFERYESLVSPLTAFETRFRKKRSSKSLE